MQRNFEDTNRKETNAVEENEPKIGLDNREEADVYSVEENEPKADLDNNAETEVYSVADADPETDPKSDVQYNSQDADSYVESDVEEDIANKDFSVDEIRELYKDYYPPDIIEDYCTIKQLMNAEVINRNLAKLEKLIVAKMDQINSHQTLFKTIPSAHDIFMEVMETWAIENGYIPQYNYKFCAAVIGENGIERRETIELPAKSMRLYNFVPHHLFKSFVLKYKNIFNDIGASITHGEFTHFLQWFVLTEENKGKRILNNHPADLMRIMGEISSAKILPWDILFDRNVENDSYNNPNLFLSSVDGRRQYDYPDSEAEELNPNLFPNLRKLLLQIAASRDPEYVQSTELFYGKEDYQDILNLHRQSKQLKVDDCILLDVEQNKSIYFDDITDQVKYMRNHLLVHRELATKDEYLPYDEDKSLFQNLNQQMIYLAEKFNIKENQHAEEFLLSLRDIFKPEDLDIPDDQVIFSHLLNKFDQKLDFDKLPKEFAKFMYALADVAISFIKNKHDVVYQVVDPEINKKQKIRN